MMLLVDGDIDADGGSSDAVAAGGRSRRRDCNIGQRLHSCFKLDLLKSFRRTMSTRAKLNDKYIFYRTVILSPFLLFVTSWKRTCVYIRVTTNDSFLAFL